MDDKGKDRIGRYREEEFQRSKEQLARFNQEMAKVTPKATLPQWTKDALLAVATGVACGVGTTIILAFFLGHGLKTLLAIPSTPLR